MRPVLWPVLLLACGCADGSSGGSVEDTDAGADTTTTTVVPTSSSTQGGDGTEDTGATADTGGTGSTSAATDCSDPDPAASIEVVLPTPTGDLRGTWSTPAGCPPFPTVLFHVGSGPTDRDGNTVGAMGSNDGHLQLAERLQRAGIASLRYDKRGVAGSADAVDAWEDVVVDTYVEDLLGFVDLMRSESGAFGPVTLLGHSEGSVFATLAAARGDIDALVLVAGPGRPLADVLRAQLQQNLDDPDLLAAALEIIDELEMGNMVDQVPLQLLSLFDPSVQPFLISLFAVDPAQALSVVDVPTAIIAGTADIQVPVSEAEVLAAAKPDATLVVIENMTHVFKDAGEGQNAAYFDPTVPLAEGFAEAVIDHVAVGR